MIIGERVRIIREKKKLTHKELEKRSGILSTYISRVENGHIVPSVGEMEEIAKGLDVPLQELFYDSTKPPPFLANLSSSYRTENDIGSSTRKVGLVGWLRTQLSKLH